MITGLAKDKFLEIKEKDPFMRGLSKIGLKQTEIFYERSKRSKGKSKFPIFASLNHIEKYLEQLQLIIHQLYT